jgi:RNA polymerase sigma-70 factor (ECF subfamily)
MNGTPVEHTDQELASAALRGDRRAFGELVVRYRDGVVNVVYRMCGDGNLAEEAAQEAFIRAWTHLASYKPQYAFRGWIYRIAINAALDALRSGPRTVAIDDLPLESDSEPPEERVVRKERADWVRQAVMALPPASRAVLVLREYEGLSYNEIAAALSIPIGTVMSRLNYARQQLRKALAPVAQAGQPVRAGQSSEQSGGKSFYAPLHNL